MATTLEHNESLDELELEHRTWLQHYAPQHLEKWSALAREPAMAEAGVRRLLERQGVSVSPAETLAAARPSPEFLCVAGTLKFYAAVSCISRDIAAEETGIPVDLDFQGSYGLLNKTIWSACAAAAPKCTDLPHPTLVAIATFHFWAAEMSFAKSKIETLLSRKAADVGRSVFLKADESRGERYLSSPVSGLLLCGLASRTPRTFGVLHPNPIHAFDPGLLPQTSFCMVGPGLSDDVEWKQISIVDWGVGPRLATSRITVQDLVPYFVAGSSPQEITRWIPTLSSREIAVAERYYQEHKQELLEEDRAIQERRATQVNTPWVEQVAAEARAERLALMEKLRTAKVNGGPQ